MKALEGARMKQSSSKKQPQLAAHANKNISDVEIAAVLSEYVNNAAEGRFGDAPTLIDWEYWAHRMPRWTAAQAARLMCALDPDTYESLEARPNKNDVTSPTLDAKKIQRLAEAMGMAEATGSEWVAWADKQNIPVHSLLRAEVRDVQYLSLDANGSQPPAKFKASGTAAKSGTVVVRNKLRTNTLDAPIAEAIKSAGSTKVGDVYPKLRELALDEVVPFNGRTDGDALCYTDDYNLVKKLTKNALRKRLDRLSGADGNGQ